MKILAAGDVHANIKQLRYVVFPASVEQGADVIVGLGDFGYRYSEAFTSALTEHFEETGIRTFFIDGNHDDHELLTALGGFGAETEVELWPGVTYLPRGHSWGWDGLKFLALGGAFSIDKYRRTPGSSWWWQEAITDTQVDRAIANGKVDIMFTHDAPPSDQLERWLNAFGYKVGPESRHQRDQIARVIEVCKPDLLVHGHYHERYTTFYGDTLVEGLGCDGSGPLSLFMIDTDDYKTTPPEAESDTDQ